jgi:hypothetical protein
MRPAIAIKTRRISKPPLYRPILDTIFASLNGSTRMRSIGGVLIFPTPAMSSWVSRQ